jgi:hypothetical protein
MSEKKEGAPATVGGVPIGIVKGGTTTSSYDNELAKRKLDAERRRAHQDRMYATRDAAVRQGDAARIGSVNLMGPETPRLVLNYLNADKTVRQQAVSEITLVPIPSRPTEWEATFTLVCPKCVARGVSQGESQMYIRDSHRKFTLDERRKGEVVIVDFCMPDGDKWQTHVVIAGTVSVHDIVKCDNYNCNFRCRIENSNVIEV